jgi:amino acid transporter
VPTYLLPMLISLAATSDWTSFAAGAFTDAGSLIGGPLLASWIGAAGMVASLSMFNAYTLSYSRIPFAMAQDGFLPRGLARTHRRHGTPWVALLAGGVVYAALTLIPSEKIVQALLVLEMWCFSVLYILLYIALWRVRVRPALDPGAAQGDGAATRDAGASAPAAYRFIIPLGARGIWLVILPPIILIVLAMFGSGEEYVRYGGPAVLSGVALYPIAAWLRRRHESSKRGHAIRQPS